MSLSSDDKRRIDLILADWMTKLGGDDGPRYETAFRLWLKEDPAHRTAHDAFLDVIRDVGLTSLPTPPLQRPRIWVESRLPLRAALAGVAVLAVCGAGALIVRDRVAVPMLAGTRIAAGNSPRALDLPGGPSMMLDSHAVILASLEGGQSRITLLGGRARIRVPMNLSARFVVAAGNLRLTAHGAVFDIALDGDTVRITPLAGRVVALRQGATPNGSTRLETGIQLVADRTGEQLVNAPKDEANWTSALLSLDGKTLGTIVTIGNARGGKPIILADAALSMRRMQGQLPAADTRSLALQLAAALDLELRETDHDYVLARKT